MTKYKMNCLSNHYQMNCLRNEIDNISEQSVKDNNSPMIVHGQFQTIVNKIDEILEGKVVYGKPNYWENPPKDRK